MPDLTEEFVRRISNMESQIQKLKTQKHLYEVLNTTRIYPSGTENNWDIPDVDNLVVEATVAAITINGIANGVNGRVLFVQNAKAGVTLTFTHNNAAAAAGNKIVTQTGASVALTPGMSLMAVYTYQIGLTDYAWRIYWNS